MKQKKNTKSAKTIGTILLLTIFITGACVAFFFSQKFNATAIKTFYHTTPFQINGNAMSPTYINGEYVLTSPIRSSEAIKRGEIIVFAAPDSVGTDYIKRVIGISGDTVMVLNGSVYLNGKILDEHTYLPVTIKTYGGTFLSDGQTITVSKNSYFVLGDNRPYSADSRQWGFIPQANVISIAGSCYLHCR